METKESLRVKIANGMTLRYSSIDYKKEFTLSKTGNKAKVTSLDSGESHFIDRQGMLCIIDNILRYEVKYSLEGECLVPV